MLDDLRARVEFRQALEQITETDAPESSSRDALSGGHARAFLDYHDQLRRRVREFERRDNELRQRLAKIVTDGDRNLNIEALVRALADEFRVLRSGQTARAAAMSRDLVSLRAELADAKRKLDPVLRYAYNLRKLVEFIYANESPSPAVARRIESLLRSGGVQLPPRNEGGQPAGAAATAATAPS